MRGKNWWLSYLVPPDGTLKAVQLYFVRHHVGRKVRSSMHRVGDADELHDEELQEEIPIEY